MAGLCLCNCISFLYRPYRPAGPIEHIGLQATDSTASPSKLRGPQFGFKELASGINPIVDIVAIHGIDGDRDASWTAENGVFWLRDLLPAEIPNARILTYGYDAHTHGQDRLATDFMHDHAMTFISKLTLLRENSAASRLSSGKTVERPIIFIAHSSGGLLLKSALIHSHLCNDGHLKNHRAISRSTHAVAFFGTPHVGSATAELARSILDTGSPSTPTNTVLLRHLERDSEALQHQLMQYSAISGQFETKFFYEIYDTDFAGVSKKIVPKASAVVPGAVNAESIGLNKDHVHMVKFASVEDEDFRTVSNSLSLMSKAACQKMVEKEDHHKSAIKSGLPVAPEGGVGIMIENIKAVTDNVGKIEQKIDHLARAARPRVIEARFDMDDRQRCLEGTRVQLLDTVRRWASQNNSTDPDTSAFLFWLCGQAGTGKTTICSSVADTCHAEGRLGASFFFSRAHEARNNIRLVFPTIADQLGTFCEEFGGLVSGILRKDPDLVRSDPQSQLEKLIINPLNNCASFPTGTIIVMDALDECKDDNSISTLLSMVSKNRHRLTRLRFFITSRPVGNIRLGFEPLRDITQSLILHDIDTAVVDADIKLYLRKGFSTAPSIYPHLVEQGWPSDEAIIRLVNTASRLFIFAATALRFILDESYSDPKSQLTILLEQSQGVESSPSPFFYLDQMYLQVLHQAFPNPTPSNRFTLLKKVLGAQAIVLLRNPLSPGDLEILLGLGHGVIRTTLRHLHSIIVVPDTDAATIRLIHPSFFDFSTLRCPDPRFLIDLSSHHEQLATFCFEQMKNLKRDICEIKDASKLNEEIEDLPERITRYLTCALRYACHHWVFHMCNAGESPTLQISLNRFCHQNLLYWIEALSLLGPESLQDGIRHIQALQTHLTNYSSLPTEPVAILKDTQAFITEYFELISSVSLQLYRTALPLSSPSNTLRRAFSHELSGGVRVLQRAREGNYSGVTILRGHSKEVKSAEFSPDDTRVVSATHDETRVWDVGTGTQLKTLKIGGYISSVCFFGDRERIISVVGGENNSICIWDVASGACLRTTQLEGTDETHCYPFICSPDISRIAGSAHNDVLIWDLSNGSLLNTHKGHNDQTVMSLAFSPNHMLFAFGFTDSTIRIWDAVSGDHFNTLSGKNSSAVTSVAFSPCNKYLVSSWDYDLRLWDISRGDTTKIFKGHSSVISVAFSSDGTQIISGSENGELRVWNLDGEVLKTLRLGWGDVKNVGFSFGGSHYICTFGNSTYIWDADRASDLDRSEKQFYYINFSPDGSLLAASISNHVHLLDGLTGDSVKVIKITSKGHDIGHFYRSGISPNNQYVVAFSQFSHIFYVWDISSPTAPRTLKGHSKHVKSVAFSADSTQILSTSDKTLRIWNITSGDNIFTIKVKTHYSSHVQFSPDGSQIIADTNSYKIPRHLRSHPVPLNDPVVGQLQYSLAFRDEWVFASRGDKMERCIWLPVDWREDNAVSSRGRVAIGTRHGLVLLDLSDIQ